MRVGPALLLTLLSLGRPAAAQAPAPIPAPAQAAGGASAAAAGAPPPASRAPLPEPPARPSAIEQAVADYGETGRAAVVTEHDAVYLPFGEEIPEIRCAPLQLCDITLEPGEELRDTALGDTRRWLIFATAYGNPLTPIVTLKPTEEGLRTTLLITTARRAYRLRLASPSKKEAGKGRIDHVRFYYPEETLQSWRRAAAEAAAEAARREEGAAPLAPSSLSRLNFAYRIEGARWKPALAFDDGTQTVLRFAVAPPHEPALLVEVGGQTLAVNYRSTPAGWLVDRVFDRARLVVKVGRREESVLITNLRTQGR